MPAFSELAEVSTLGLRGFDRSAKAVMGEYGAHGWRGRIGRRGHAILLSPEGGVTACVPGKLDPDPRALRNSRRPLDRWLRGKENRMTVLDTAPAVAEVKVDPVESGSPALDRYTCSDCGKAFTSARALSGHRRGHEVVTCPECGRVTTQAGLGPHKRVHRLTADAKARKRPAKATKPLKNANVSQAPKVAPEAAVTPPSNSVAERLTALVSDLVAENEALRAEIADLRAWIDLAPRAGD